MGAVGWTSAVAERDYYQAEQAREEAEIDATPEDTITAIHEAWLATMMDEELDLQPVQAPDIVRSAVVITIAILVGRALGELRQVRGGAQVDPPPANYAAFVFQASPLIAGRNAADMLFPSLVGAFLTRKVYPRK